MYLIDSTKFRSKIELWLGAGWIFVLLFIIINKISYCNFLKSICIVLFLKMCCVAFVCAFSLHCATKNRAPIVRVRTFSKMKNKRKRITCRSSRAFLKSFSQHPSNSLLFKQVSAKMKMWTKFVESAKRSMAKLCVPWVEVIFALISNPF